MNFIYFIIIAVVIGIIFAIYQGAKNSKHKKESMNIFDSLKDFTVSENYLSETSGISIGYDANRKKSVY